MSRWYVVGELMDRYGNSAPNETAVERNKRLALQFKAFLRSAGGRVWMTEERRARRSGVNSRSRQRVTRRLWFTQKGICPLCDLLIETIEQANIDHIVPRTRGGSNQLTNLQVTHIQCNSLKGDRLMEELYLPFTWK